MLQRPAAAIVSSSTRNLASGAVAHSHEHLPEKQLKPVDVKTSRCTNGLAVTSVDRHGPLSRLAFAFRAGSRYETDAMRGCSHQLRNAVGLGSQHHSAYELLWRAGMLGANVNTYTTRDLFVVTLDAWRDYAVPALEVLGALCCQPAFKAHEMKDTKDYFQIERALMKENPSMRCLELLHRAAYRNGPLATSLLTPKSMIGKHTTNMMLQYAREHLVSGEACVVGVNIDHEQILKYAQSCPIVDGKSLPLPQSPYLGGQERKHTGGALTHVMIAGQTAGLKDARAGAAGAVYGALLSAGPMIKYASSNGHGKVAQAVSSAIGEHTLHGVTSICTLYADQGLAGVYCVAEHANSAKVVRATVQTMKQLAQSGPSAEDLKRAKRVALAGALMRSECEDAVLEDMITQTLNGQNVATEVSALEKTIDAISQTDVQQLAKKIIDKPTMAAVGNLSSTPYLDELH